MIGGRSRAVGVRTVASGSRDIDPPISNFAFGSDLRVLVSSRKAMDLFAGRDRSLAPVKFLHGGLQHWAETRGCAGKRCSNRCHKMERGLELSALSARYSMPHSSGPLFSRPCQNAADSFTAANRINSTQLHKITFESYRFTFTNPPPYKTRSRRRYQRSIYPSFLWIPNLV